MRLLARNLAAGILASLVLVGRPGAAQVVLGADVGGAKESGSRWGGAVDGRFGWRFGLPRAAIVHSIIFQLEAIAGYDRLPPWDAGTAVERLGGGGRIGLLLGWLEPFGLSHASIADAAGKVAYLVDVGAALDWRLPAWSLGLHWSHDWLGGNVDSVQFDELGVHVELRGFWF